MSLPLATLVRHRTQPYRSRDRHGLSIFTSLLSSATSNSISKKRRCPLVIESEDRRIKCYAVLSWSKHIPRTLGTKHPKTSNFSEPEIDFLGQQQRRVFIVLGPFQFTNGRVAKCLLFWEGSFCVRRKDVGIQISLLSPLSFSARLMIFSTSVEKLYLYTEEPNI